MDNREIAYQLTNTIVTNQLTNTIVTKSIPIPTDSEGLLDAAKLAERVGQLYLKILEKVREGGQ